MTGVKTSSRHIYRQYIAHHLSEADHDSSLTGNWFGEKLCMNLQTSRGNRSINLLTPPDFELPFVRTFLQTWRTSFNSIKANLRFNECFNPHLSVMMQLLKMVQHFRQSWLGRKVLALIDFCIPAWLWEEWGRHGWRPVFVLLCCCVSTLPFFFRNAPWVLFVNHPATDTSLCLHLFTASGNVAPRLFWRGLTASYLTDLPMKSQTHSIGLQCYT